MKYDLEERTAKFAEEIIKTVRKIKINPPDFATRFFEKKYPDK